MLGALRGRTDVFGYTDIFKIDELGNIIKGSSSGHMPPDGDSYGWILSHGMTGTSPILVPTPCVNTVGLYDERLVWAADLDYMLRLAERFEISVVREPLYGYRIHAQRTTSRMETLVREVSETKVLEAHLKRNWSRLDDTQRFRVIRRIQRAAIMSKNVPNLMRWVTNWTFVKGASTRAFRRIQYKRQPDSDV